MKQIVTSSLYALSLTVIGILISSCQTTAVKEASPAPPLVFPPAPEEARYVYEMTLYSSAQLKRQDAETNWRKILTGEGQGAGTGLSKPYDVVACKGRVYISDTVMRMVHVFDFQGQSYSQIGIEEPGELRKPLGMNTDAACNLYVADGTINGILIYDANGRFLKAVGGAAWFNRLSHVAVSPDGGRIYAVDTGGVETSEHRIRVFDTNSGEHLFDIGERGRDHAKFNLPKDIEIGADGNIFLVDSGNFRVQVLSPTGEFLRTFGSIGNRTGQFSRPKGIALDPQGNIYVSDAAFGNFQIFNNEGQLLMFIGSRATSPGPGRYQLPSGIDVDEDGRVYFVDQFFRKVDVYRPVGLGESEGYVGNGVLALKQ